MQLAGGRRSLAQELAHTALTRETSKESQASCKNYDMKARIETQSEMLERSKALGLGLAFGHSNRGTGQP